MNKRIKSILMIVSILILLCCNYVFAVSGEFSVNKNSATIEIGKTTTFSITATNCGGKFTITSSNPNVATVSSAEEWVENASKEITITAKSQGTATITVKAYDVATSDSEPEEVTGSRTITVTVPEKKNENNTDTGEGNSSSGNNTPTVTKSSEARLSNFGINPKEYDFSGFSKNPDKEEWNAGDVPNSVKEIEIYAKAKHSKATIQGTGKVQLKEGSNTFEVKVTAEDGKTTKTYKLTINRKKAEEESTKSGENRLKSLGLNPKEYDFTGFKSDITEYSVEVPNEIKEIEVYAKATDSNAQITGIGMVELKEGQNELKIEVTAENGDKKTYTLNVTRKVAETTAPAPVEEKFGLSKLTVAGLTITPQFDIGIYEYTLNLSQDLGSLEIIAKANDENASVEIVGNENLKQGENVITILVKNPTTEKIATYQIIVNKNVVIEEVTKSWLDPSTWGKEEIIKITIIVVLIILIIIAIILKIKISKDSINSRKVALPGAEELDKAIAEHQELVDEPNNIEQNYIEEIAKNRITMNNFEDKPKRKGRHF